MTVSLQTGLINPIGMLTKATTEMRQTVRKIDDALRLEHKEIPDFPDE